MATVWPDPPAHDPPRAVPRVEFFVILPPRDPIVVGTIRGSMLPHQPPDNLPIDVDGAAINSGTCERTKLAVDPHVLRQIRTLIEIALEQAEADLPRHPPQAP